MVDLLPHLTLKVVILSTHDQDHIGHTLFPFSSQNSGLSNFPEIEYVRVIRSHEKWVHSGVYQHVIN